MPPFSTLIACHRRMRACSGHPTTARSAAVQPSVVSLSTEMRDVLHKPCQRPPVRRNCCSNSHQGGSSYVYSKVVKSLPPCPGVVDLHIRYTSWADRARRDHLQAAARDQECSRDPHLDHAAPVDLASDNHRRRELLRYQVWKLRNRPHPHPGVFA